MILSAWLAANADAVEGRSVVELGCGLAQCGLTAGAAGASAVAVTDFSPGLLAAADAAAAANGLSDRVAAFFLDWAVRTGRMRPG